MRVERTPDLLIQRNPIRQRTFRTECLSAAAKRIGVACLSCNDEITAGWCTAVHVLLKERIVQQIEIRNEPPLIAGGVSDRDIGHGLRADMRAELFAGSDRVACCERTE